MEIIDIIFLIILTFFFIQGFRKGLIREVISLLALIIGIYISIHFSFYTKNLLMQYLKWKELYISILTIIITFLIVIMSIVAMGRILTKIVSFTPLGIINNLMGGLLSMLKIILILPFLLDFVEKQIVNIPSILNQMEKSNIYPVIKKVRSIAFPIIVDPFYNFLIETIFSTF